MERRRFSQTMASVWQTAFVVSHKMPWCALLTAVKNYNKSFEKLQDFFFKTETKTKIKCSRPRPRLHDPRPRLSFLSSRRVETKTLVSRITSLVDTIVLGWPIKPAITIASGEKLYLNLVICLQLDIALFVQFFKIWHCLPELWQCIRGLLFPGHSVVDNPDFKPMPSSAR